MSSQVNSISTCVCVFRSCVCAWACLYPSDKLLSGVYWHHSDQRWITISRVTTMWLFLLPLFIILDPFLSLCSYSAALFHTLSICHLSSPDNTRSSLNGWRWWGQEIVFSAFSFFVFVRFSLPPLSLFLTNYFSHISIICRLQPLCSVFSSFVPSVCRTACEYIIFAHFIGSLCCLGSFFSHWQRYVQQVYSLIVRPCQVSPAGTDKRSWATYPSVAETELPDLIMWGAVHMGKTESTLGSGPNWFRCLVLIHYTPSHQTWGRTRNSVGRGSLHYKLY